MSAKVTLKKTETGYVTADGRWTVTRNTASSGVNMIGGYAGERVYWVLEDTTGQARIGSALNPSAPHRRTVDRLWEARDIIAHASKAV